MGIELGLPDQLEIANATTIRKKKVGAYRLKLQAISKIEYEI